MQLRMKARTKTLVKMKTERAASRKMSSRDGERRRWGAYIASVWLLLIAINLVTTGQYFDIALRDIGLCLSAFGLAKLTESGAPVAA